MGLRTGEDYLASLDDGRQVWLDGERVDVLEDSRLAPCAQAIAGIYDLQHDPKHRELLVMASPTTGEPVSLAYLEPRSTEDLLRRRAMIEFLMRRTGAVMGRLPEYMALILLGLYDIRERLAEENVQFRKNVEAYLDFSRAQDLCLTHGFADPPHDRGRTEAFPYLKVVDQTARGITIRGAKAVATLAPYANEYVGLTTPRPDVRPEEVLYFGIPLNTRGVKVICRPSLSRSSGHDHPLGAAFDEMDAWVVFEDVFVPMERVFFLNRPDLNAAIFAQIPRAFGYYHILIRMAVKADILAGIGAAVADYLGTTNTPAVHEALFELVAYAETLRAFLFAAERQTVQSASGMTMANPTQVLLGRVHAVERLPAILQRVRDICGSSLLMAPAHADLASPEIGGAMRSFLAGEDRRATDRFRLLKLAWDYTADSFGSRQLLFEQYNANTVAVNKARVLGLYDLAPMIELAKRLAGVDEL